MGQVGRLSIKKWNVLPYDRQAALRLAVELGIPPLLAVLLQIRGAGDAQRAQELLGGGPALSDPLLLPDMEKAVGRINRALDGFEKIAVFGDYDADGVTATAMLYSYLESCGGDVVYYIPDRESEGYGLSFSAVDRLNGQGVRLIVTVDNGISSVEEVEHASVLGIDIVVTDHHRPGATLPPAYAVVDAWRDGCRCPFRDFSGAGVAFQLIAALEGPDGDAQALLENYADLAAIGTIGDVVPLTGENRTLVRAGLALMARSDRPGIQALVEQSGMESRRLTAENVAFTIVPRINATGRMGSADRAVRLLTAESPEDAGALAVEICAENGTRRRMEDDVCREVAVWFDKNPKSLLDRVLVVSGEGWHCGVIGIVAARVVEKFGKPCIVISSSGDTAKGSGRSVEGFSLFDAVCACGELLVKFGGHPMAAGMTLKTENIGPFREAINRYAASLAKPMPFPALSIDCVLKPEKLSADIPDWVSRLEPFGTGNPRPVFGLAHMALADITPVGGGKHLRLTLRKGSASVTCMRFGTTLEEFGYRIGDEVDAAVVLEKKEFNGRPELTVVVRELRFTGSDTEELLSGRALYEKFRRGEPLAEEEAERLFPAREDFEAVYRAVRSSGGYSGRPENFLPRIPGGKITLPKLLVSLDVFAERRLIELHKSAGNCSMRIVPAAGKVRLRDSSILFALQSFIKAGEKQWRGL